MEDTKNKHLPKVNKQKGRDNAELRFWDEFKLSDSEQEDIVRRFLHVYEQCGNDNMRKEWIRRKRNNWQVYEQKREPRRTCIGNWPFFHVPVSAMIVDKVHNNIYNAFDTDKIVNPIGVDNTDKEYEESGSKILNTILIKKSKIKESLDSAVRDVLVSGSGYVGTPIVEYRERKYFPDNNGILAPTEIIERYPGTERISPEDVVFTPDARYNGIQKCSALIIKRNVLYADLVENANNGNMINIDEKAIETENEKTSADSNNEIKQEVDENDGIDAENIDEKYYESVRVLEVYAKFDYKNQGTTEWQFWITPANKKLVRWHVSTLPNRPIVDICAKARGDSLYARSLMDDLDNLSIEMDTIFNDILQSLALTILPPFAYDANDAQFDPKKFTWGMLQFFPIADPSRSIQQIKIDADLGAAITVFNQLFQLAQSLTSISDYALGGGGHETATGVNALTRATISNLQATMGRISKGVAKIGEHVFNLLARLYNEEFFASIDPEWGSELYRKISKEKISAIGAWDFVFVPELEQSKEVKRREFLELYNLTMPIITQVPEGAMPDSIYYMLKEAFAQFGHGALARKVLGKERMGDRGLRGYPQDMENMMLLQGDVPIVSLDDNHEEHLAELDVLLGSEEYMLLDETEKGNITRHRQSHMKMLQAMEETGRVGLNLPNMQQPSANNAVPTPEAQRRVNEGELSDRIQAGNAQLLG